MWRRPAVNAYVDSWVAPRMRAQFGVSRYMLSTVSAEMVNTLVTETRGSARRTGSTSLLWINGRDVRTAWHEQLLTGSTAPPERAPGRSGVDHQPRFRAVIRLATSRPGAWSSSRSFMIRSEHRTRQPHPGLADWIRSHPGRHDQGFTGMTFQRSMYALAGGVEQFQHGSDDGRYMGGMCSRVADPVRPYFGGGPHVSA